jgi:hypothetical protein
MTRNLSELKIQFKLSNKIKIFGPGAELRSLDRVMADKEHKLNEQSM